MPRRFILFVSVPALSLAAATAEPAEQWYKDVDNNFVARERDGALCTQNRVADEECLEGKDWGSLSAAATKLAPSPAAPERTRTD